MHQCVMSDSTISNLPQIAVKTANIVFALGGLFSVLIAAYAAYRISSPIFSVYLTGEVVEGVDWTEEVRNLLAAWGYGTSRAQTARHAAVTPPSSKAFW